MLLLTGTTDLVRVVTAEGTCDVEVHADWMDNLSGAITPGRTNTASITTATTTTVVASPAASTQRNVKGISIRNNHATTTSNIKVTHTDGTTSGPLIGCALLAGESLILDQNGDWYHYDVNGGQYLPSSIGRYIKTTLLTSASANFTAGPTTNTIKIRGVAGGGGGGGCTSVVSAAAAAGGGSSGGYAEKTFAVTPGGVYAYTCGALGAGGINAIGTAGGDSTFIVGATTVTCKGGLGGPVGTAINALSVTVGAAAPAISTNGDVNKAGEPGQKGVVVIQATPIGVSGAGGSCIFGNGGGGISAVGTGLAALGNGGGGGGAFTGASANRTGGAGTGGLWIVDEYS